MFKIRYRYLLVLLLSAYSYANILFTVGNRLFDFELSWYYLFGLLLLVVLITWELNRLIESKSDQLQRWLGGHIHPLVILFFCSLLNVVIASVGCLYALYLLLGMPLMWNSEHLKLLLAFGFRVNLFLNCINAIYFFMDRLKKTQVEAEQFKKESVEAQFEALRNQINPHFLFNCFNALSSLVYKDADVSAKFIAQLSVVYRYLLYNQEKKVVRLKEELSFIDAYFYLLKIRFGDNIIIDKQIRAEDENYFLAPATLQMLIENAIKHNVVSSRFPLHIHLFIEDHWIVVSNSLQEKQVKEDSTHIGLKNIQSRYAFLSDEEVKIIKTSSEFLVKIPLVSMDVV